MEVFRIEKTKLADVAFFMLDSKRQCEDNQTA
jgi:hypothetical protein